MPRILVKYQGRETVYDRAETVTTIGRAEGNRLTLLDPTVSHNHCRIEKSGSDYILVDLGGKNGTRVNGIRVERHTLKPGDTIQIGATLLVFQGAATKSGTVPMAKRFLFTGQEERFVLDVATGDDAGRRVFLNREVITIGRESQCDLALRDQAASRVHAVIRCTPTEFLIEDQKTRNGTEVNGKKISQPCPLKHGDEIRIGTSRLIFRDLASLAHRVETVAMGSSQERTPDLVPAAETTPVDGRHFVHQLAERETARRRRRVVIMLVILLLAGGLGFFAAKKYGLFEKKEGFTAVNLLKENPGFESLLPSKLPRGWSFDLGSASRWRVAAIPGGGTCLDLEGAPPGEPEAVAEALCEERVRVTAGRQYQASARIRSEGQKGIALLKAQWLKEGKPYMETYSQPMWGAHDWLPLTAVFTPPDGATEVQVACVGVGNADPLFFDDVTLYEGVSAEATGGFLRAPVGTFSICLDAKGVFYIVSGNRVVLWGGEARLEGLPNGPLMRQAFASIEKDYPASPSPGWCNFATWVVDVSTMTLVNLRQSTNPVAGGFLTLAYTIIGDREQARPVKWVGTVMMLPADVVHAGIGVGSGIETLTQTGEFKVAQANGLILGKGAERVVIDFGTPHGIPFELAGKKETDHYVLTAYLPLKPMQEVIQPMQRLEWSLTFGRLSSKRAKDFILQAREAAGHGDKVAAMNIYQKLIEGDLFPESDKKVAQAEFKAIEDSIGRLIAPVRDEVAKAIRMADPDELKVAEIDVKELREKYGKTKFGPELAGLQQQIDDFRQGKVVKAEGDVVELLKKAKMNFEKEAWLVAKVFAENVIRKGGPNTEQAKEAQKILDALPKAREEAKARDEWITKRLSSAATFEKNNMPARAVPIYEEILKKYPKSKWTDEVTKKMEEAKKKAR